MSDQGTIREQILVVDDDHRIRNMLARFLAEQGYVVNTAADGVQMWKQLKTTRPDLILLDLNLPGGKDGLDLAREVRGESDVPIMMLSGRDDVVDRIVGIEIGADDYVAKPFHLREIHARLKAILRRRRLPSLDPQLLEEKIAVFDRWELDLSRRKLTSMDGNEVYLTTGEFEMLAILVRHPGRVLTRDFLMNETRARGNEVFDRAIDTQIARLRRKIERDSRCPQIIKSVRGVGYVFAVAVYHEPRGREARRS